MWSCGLVCEFASHRVTAPPLQKCVTSHGEQTTEPARLYVPGGHVTHSLAPDADTCVALHCVHVVLLSAWVAGENVSVGHSAHPALARVLCAYVPGSQLRQDVLDVVSDSAEYVPARHSAQANTPSPEYVPAEQSLHSTGSAAPRAVREQECLRTSWCTWLHAVALFVPIFHVFAGHGRHVLVSRALCFPVGHCMVVTGTQGAEPATNLYEPEAHRAHGPPSAPCHPGSHTHADLVFPPTSPPPDPAGHARHAVRLLMQLFQCSSEHITHELCVAA